MAAEYKVMTVMVVKLGKIHTRTPPISHRALPITFHPSSSHLTAVYKVRTVVITKETQERNPVSFIAEENHLDSYVVPID